MVYWITWFIVRIIRIFFFPLKVYGLENIPSKGGFILASNHRSYLDPMIIPILLKRRISFVAKESLFKRKLFGAFLRQLEAFPIRRSSADIRAIKEIIGRLKRGMPVLIFPEGTRTQQADASVGKKKISAGVGLVAVKSNLPVIPVYINGSDKVLFPGRKKLIRYPVNVFFGSPVIFSRDKSYQEISVQIMKKINFLGEKDK